MPAKQVLQSKSAAGWTEILVVDEGATLSGAVQLAKSSA
jgi:hypothetical protein